MEDVSNPDYEIGLLMTLLDQVSLYIYERKDIEEIEEILREDKRKKKYHPTKIGIKTKKRKITVSVKIFLTAIWPTMVRERTIRTPQSHHDGQ